MVNCIDGYQMARQGRAGPALAIAASVRSLRARNDHADCALWPPPCRNRPQVRFAGVFFLMLMGLVAAAVLSQGDMAKSLAMVAVACCWALWAAMSIPHETFLLRPS